MVLSTGQPLLLKDRAATQAYGIRTVPGTEPSQSSVFVPVMVDQQIRAAIRLVSLDREDAFDQATVSPHRQPARVRGCRALDVSTPSGRP